MKILFSVSKAMHQLGSTERLIEGMKKHGDEGTIVAAVPGYIRSIAMDGYDAVATWGWRHGSAVRALGHNVLVMERAYVDDRFKWFSMGWNGLNGRATWPDIEDDSRWGQNFSHLMQPWQSKPDGYALIMGQVPTDAALRHVPFIQWAARVAEELSYEGFDPVYRAHPRSPSSIPTGVRTVRGTLKDALEGAKFVVTYNSNSAVDAVLHGVPTIAYDLGSMAYDVTSHDIKSSLRRCDRSKWAARLAWRQWLPEELADGTAWEVIKAAMPRQLEAA